MIAEARLVSLLRIVGGTLLAIVGLFAGGCTTYGARLGPISGAEGSAPSSTERQILDAVEQTAQDFQFREYWRDEDQGIFVFVNDRVKGAELSLEVRRTQVGVVLYIRDRAGSKALDIVRDIEETLLRRLKLAIPGSQLSWEESSDLWSVF